MKNNQSGFIVPVLIFIIAALSVGGAYYVHTKKVDSGSTSAVSQETQATVVTDVSRNNVKINATDTTSLKMNLTLQELLAQNKGKDLVCTGTSNTADGVGIASTVYINGSMIRGDATTTIKGTTTKGSVIIKGNVIYGWSGTHGSKITLNGTFDLNAALSMGGTTNPINQKAEYSCTPWIVDASKFSVPASVQFTDFGSMKIPAISAEMIQEMKAKAGK